MITLNADFSFERDEHCWKLYRWRDGKDKDGNPKRRKTITYHSTLRQICEAVIDRKAGECTSINKLFDLLNNAEAVLTKHVEEKASHRFNVEDR